MRVDFSIEMMQTTCKILFIDQVQVANRVIALSALLSGTIEHVTVLLVRYECCVCQISCVCHNMCWKTMIEDEYAYKRKLGIRTKIKNLYEKGKCLHQTLVATCVTVSLGLYINHAVNSRNNRQIYIT